MIPFQAFQFAMMGSAVTEMQHAERERHTQDLEAQYGELREHYGELRDYAENLYREHEELKAAYNHLSNEYHKLGLGSIRIIEDLDNAEQERDFLLGDNEELHRNLGELKAAMERVNSEYEKAKEQFDQFMQENGKKLQLYEYMKKVLTALFANADRVLTEEITPEYREKMSKFLDQLP